MESYIGGVWWQGNKVKEQGNKEGMKDQRHWTLVFKLWQHLKYFKPVKMVSVSFSIL